MGPIPTPGVLGATVWELTNLAPLVAIPLPLQLLGFGSALLDNVDPNPENFVGAGIIQTKALQVGCLLRLEPNAQAQVSRGLEGPPERDASPPTSCALSAPPLVFLYPPTLIFVSLYPFHPLGLFYLSSFTSVAFIPTSCSSITLLVPFSFFSHLGSLVSPL